ncbi:hypothetical protein AB0N05_12055 [Nocardia sp. NPDC051030]|uniref:bestrophin-like domain n=1 Tax=Nocardia sp. NPDC051030 TaxID=3155162 RepID=UPI00341978D5
MFTWIGGIPAWLGYLLLTGVAVGLTCAGTLLSRSLVRKICGPEPGRNEMVTMVLTVSGVFYGLLLGLVAVAGYDGFTNARDRVADEAAALGTLYREVSAYPDPDRTVLQHDLAAYTENVLSDAFPALQRGDEPQGGTILVTRFQGHLLTFQPQTAAEQIVHAATIDQFASFDQDRRRRINATKSGIPIVLWSVIMVGSAINLLLLCLLSFDSVGLHLLLAGVFAFFLATMIFLIASLDHPFRGDVSVSPEPFQSMYVNVMGGHS